MKRLVSCTLLVIIAGFVLSGCINLVVPEPAEPAERTVTDAIVAPQLDSAQLSPTQIFEDNVDAVFTIYTSFDNENFFSNGSGFFVCATGIAVTNHHVMVNWPYAIIRTHGGYEYVIRGYYSYYIGADLVVVQVDGRRFPYLSLGDSDILRIGDSVFAIGSPLGYHNTFSTGVISRFDDVAEFDIYRVYGMIQFTAPISGGSSGGALLNDAGEVIGITTAGYGGDVAQALNFAVPIASLDLASAIGGEYMPLPVGEGGEATASALYVVGSWIWDHGYYIFNQDGSGSRVWSGVPDDFAWRVSGAMLVLSFDNGDAPERWDISVTNQDEIIVGGAPFTRVDDDADLETLLTAPAEPYQVVGVWDWDGGVYVFNADGSGNRTWNGVSASFEWDIESGLLELRLPDDEDELWSVTVQSENVITVGGAVFTRVQ